jgi:hypothetical protein
MTSTLTSTLDPFHLSLLTPFTWDTDPRPEIEIPPPVIIIDEPEKQEPEGQVKKTGTSLDDDKASPSSKDQADDSNKDDEEDIYYDAQEYLSYEDNKEDIYDDAQKYISDVDQEEDWENKSTSPLPVQVYNSPKKNFYNLSQLETFSRDKFRSSSTSSGTTSVPTEGSVGSVHTVYTTSSGLSSSNETGVSNQTRCGSEKSNETSSHKSNLSDTSTLSNRSTRPSLRELGPDTRSREEAFANGVPWGLHGKDYIGPEIKGHKLNDTMKGKTVTHRHGYVVFKVRNVFGRKGNKK